MQTNRSIASLALVTGLLWVAPAGAPTTARAAPAPATAPAPAAAPAPATAPTPAAAPAPAPATAPAAPEAPRAAPRPVASPPPGAARTADQGAAQAPAATRAVSAPPKTVPTPRRGMSPAAILGEASNQFSYGRYERVVRLLRPLVERERLREREDQVEALRLYGVCLFLTGRRGAARETFRTLVRLAPETRLDPRLIQPEVVAAFDAVRRDQVRQLREQARSKLRKRYGFLNLLPPVGQFQNGHWQKGVAVLSLELAFLGANIGSYYALRSSRLRQPDRTFVEKDAAGNVVKDHRPLAKALIAVNYTSLALLLGTLVYGIVDGYIYHLRHRRRLERLLDEPVTILPVLAPGGGALSLSFRY